MKRNLKSIISLIGLIVFMWTGFSLGATDTIRTFKDGAMTIPADTFSDGKVCYLKVSDGVTTGGERKILIISRLGTFTLHINDMGKLVDTAAYDGTFTGNFAISKNKQSDTDIFIPNGGYVEIGIDLDGNSDGATATIYADHIPPEMSEIRVSEKYFSPDASEGKKDTTIITFNSNEKGRYEIWVDNEIPDGKRKGTLSAGIEVSYEWNGFDEQGKPFSEGNHIVQVTVWDEAENASEMKSSEVWIDNTFPTKIDMFLLDDAFSPGTSPASQDTTYIIFKNDEKDILFYELNIDGKILLATGTLNAQGTGTGRILPGVGMVEWGGLDKNGGIFPEGAHTITLTAEDPAGNYVEIPAQVTIDNTPPRIDYLIDDSGGNPCYRNQNVWFTLQTSDWIGSMLVKADGGRGIGAFSDKVLNLIDYGNGIYGQSYRVTEEDVGTFAYSAYFEDKAGNFAINNYKRYGTITLRGNEFPPAIGARIVRLKVATPEKATFTIISNAITLATSTMTIKSNGIKQGDKIKIRDNSCVWIASAAKDGEVTVSNADIFFGFPIADYKKIPTSTIKEGAKLKGKMKIGDEITINLTTVNILETLRPPLPTRTSTSVIFEDSRIAAGTMVVAYDSSNDHIWLGTASENGRFEISNANIYFGKLVKDYKILGEIKGITASFASGGVAYVDMGIVVQGISLYDNGASTHKDVVAGDGVYSNYYTIKEMDDTTSYFYGYFTSAGNDAENNGIIKSQEEVVIDATPPVITNFGAFPGVFRQGSENVIIKYTLEEIGSNVTIEIWDEYNRRIRKLTVPDPQYGDNCNATWDGRNEGGGLVEDGTYYFKINAVDEAGNEAVERIGGIKATTINITITEVKINPSIFTPTPHIKDDADFWTNIHVTVEATKKQLQNLGFEMDTNDIYTLPYLLVDFTAYDAKGNELRPVSLPDLCDDTDSDPFTNGYPNYYTGPGTVTPLGLRPNLGSDLPDEGDGDKGNDWDTLVPLQRNLLNPNQYYIDWGVGIKDWEIPNGTYLIRIQVELVGSYWKFIDYIRDPQTKVPIAEMWHQKPNHYYGYSRTSEPVEGRVEVIDSPITKPDYIAPVVIATDPGANTIHEPTENISVVRAILMDQGGSGIDLSRSTIILKNSIGMVIAGESSNNGIDTVWWKLKEPLIIPDDYTIEVKPVDKARNGSNAAPQRFTFTILDRMGPKISDIFYDTSDFKGLVLKDNDSFGPNVIKKIYVTLSEIETGKSKIDFTSSKIIIKNKITGKEDEPHKLFYGKRTEEIVTENSGRIIYEDLKMDEGGTYTIWVEACDKATTPNPTAPIKKFTFYISVVDYINVEFNYTGLGTKTYLKIPPETKAYTITTTGIIVSTNTITIRDREKTGTITKNENYTLIKPVIEFWWFNNEHIDIKLQPPANKSVSLTMYYGDIQLPAGVTEDDLAIWRYNGVAWEKISGVNEIDKNNNKITINLPKYPDVTLEDYYAIMYRTPKPVDVQYYHYQKKKLVTCLKIPEVTTVNNDLPVGTNTITVSTLTTTRSGYVVIEPVIQFYLNGSPVVNKIEFDKEVTLIMYYTEDDVDNLSKRGFTEGDLAIYEYDGTNWIKITKGVLNQNNKEITYKTKIIREKYAIMYLIPEITEKPEVFEQSVYAYPNPAKGGKVTFRYDLIRDAKVTIKIYTIMGDEVWSKEYSSASPQGEQGSHGVYPPGDDAIIWNCENNAGKKVATGLYIYTLTASDESGEVRVTKKLIVVQ